jgi:hypothetical protein
MGLRADEARNQNVFGLDIGLPIQQLRRPIRVRRGKPIECKVTCTSLTGKSDVQGVIIHVDDIATTEETWH